MAGGFLRVVYDGGPGVAPGGTYTHSFPNWPVGTIFSVSFSYQIATMDPELLGMVDAPGEGQTSPVPEPATLLLLSAGFAGVAIKMRKRRKTRKKDPPDIQGFTAH